MTYVEPINNPNPEGKAYSYLLHFYCKECKDRSILFFHGAGNYECQHCHKIFYIRKEKHGSLIRSRKPSRNS